MTTCPNCGDPTASTSGPGTAVWCSTCDFFAELADDDGPAEEAGYHVNDYHPWQCGVGCEVCADRGDQT